MLEAATIMVLGILAAVLLVFAMQMIMPLTLLWAGVGGVNFVGGVVILVPSGD